ncbi:hypothetical protein [Timonella sp. A28]|uniref:hypothetical protein n=1 Tax=Timonella sp. A28 TaxID=3442640 RepID=UPI003EC1061B
MVKSSEQSPVTADVMYMEFFSREDGTAPTVDDVLHAFTELNLVGVAAAGATFGLDTAVIAKIAVVPDNDDAAVFVSTPDGAVSEGGFAGDICVELSRRLSAPLIADEYVSYNPNGGHEPEFVELDPRRQSIDQVVGFPDEWRVSPVRLRSRACAYASERDGLSVAEAVAADTSRPVRVWSVAGLSVVELPEGVAELPVGLRQVARDRVVLASRAGDVRCVQVSAGSRRKPVDFVVACLPRFLAVECVSGSPAHDVVVSLEPARVVAGQVSLSRRGFPHELLDIFGQLSVWDERGLFFDRAFGALSLPQALVSCVEGDWLSDDVPVVVEPPADAGKQGSSVHGWLGRIFQK